MGRDKQEKVKSQRSFTRHTKKLDFTVAAAIKSTAFSGERPPEENAGDLVWGQRKSFQ